MPGLISGSVLRTGGSGEFISLPNAQPQLPPTPTTSTGYTLVTNNLLQTSYRSSLGNIEFHLGEMWSNLPNQNIRLIGTGTSTVIVAGGTVNTNTTTGALIIEGGIGIRDGIYTGEDIFVNGLRMGTGWEGKNNVVVRGVAVPQPDDDTTGQGSIAIGYDTLLGLDTSYANIAIGRLALSSGTELTNSIAIGDRALMMAGVYQYEYRSNITGITLNNPIVITSPFHSLSTGTEILLKDIVGTVQLNNQKFYAKWLSTATFSLYSDINVSNPVSGLSYSSYSGGGTVNVTTVDDNNIAIGADAGMNLINGRENFFVGHKLATNLTTGSYNIFLGHNVANNMTRGNGNISIGGDNLVDGLDDQVNIGSLLYYNGGGYTQINSDTGVGLGTWATATYFLTTITNIENTNPVTVHFTDTYAISSGTYITFKAVTGMTELNGETYYASYQTATSVTLYQDYDLTIPLDGTGFNTYTGGGEVLALEPYGAFAVLGGAGIAGNLIVSNDVEIYGGLKIRRTITGTITTSSIALNLNGGARGSIPYQTGTSTTLMLPIGAVNSILFSDGDVPQWIPASSVPGISGTLQTVTDAGSTTTNIVYFTNTTNSTSTTTGAILIDGGIGVRKDVTVGGTVKAEHLRIQDAIMDSSYTVTTGTSTVVIDQYPTNIYRSSKYLVQVEEDIGMSSEFQIIEILLLVTNTGTVYTTDYGLITSNGELGEFSADVDDITNPSDPQLQLYFTPNTTSTKIITVCRTAVTR
jgi:hypothetical protein